MAGAIALGAAVVLTGFYIHARIVTPIEKTRVEALQLRGRTDAEAQKVLLPEFERQHQELVVRRAAYRAGGVTLLVSLAIFLAWMTWLRPASGQWSGVPVRLLKYLERADGPPGGAVASDDAGAAGSAEGRAGAAARPLSVLAGRPAPQPPPALDLGPVADILREEGRTRDALIPILQRLQTRYRYLPDAALRLVCDASDITPAQLAGVASFYNQFRLTPTGEHIIRVCEGTACHVSGAVEVRTELRRALGMVKDADTDPSGGFTIERVACIGSCSLGPVIMIDDQIHGHLSALSVSGVLRDFIESSDQARGTAAGTLSAATASGAGDLAAISCAATAPAGNARREASSATAALDVLPTVWDSGPAASPIEIRIGLGSCGIAAGAEKVRDAIMVELASLGGGATIKAVGCGGLCHHEPLVEVVGNGHRALYGHLVPADARRLVRRHVSPVGIVRAVREEMRDLHARLVDDQSWVAAETKEVDASPYLEKQVRIVLENCGAIEPLDLEAYRRCDGVRALEACLTRMTPAEVIDQVRVAGLRGRGGAGFPTAVKWDLTRRAVGSPKYLICNGDEGDPGAFMDRAVLEADPFRVIEGIVIAAYAVGASEGFIYVRREYPVAVRHVRAAIEIAYQHGLLGDRILGSSFSFALQVREGAGAFVCGEETALIQSIEGQRGMPRLRPPYPAQSGLWGKPTLINNVETLACLPWIIRRGPDAFAALGTATSKGTKVFSLAGKITRGGLIEVPMGITIREIVEDIGGGIKGGKRFKAVLAGGPSGGCIPESLADTRIDYEDLAATGAIMGSGGLVVLDERDCAVEIARYFLQFTQNESCGKCTFCRIGTKRMLEILERICAGNGRETDLQTLDDLSQQIKIGSLCGLGQTAPNPVLTTLNYFREEYEAHIRERRCPAGFCKALVHYRVLESCTGCTLCADACPTSAILPMPYVRHTVQDDLCTRCGMCVTACPEHAIEVA